ncbi:transcriptional regulator, TetR family [Desulfotomaculum arcticum]|uniref:Transcriptional regulator, TetR family n=1 Tax=Desulfotruncus arcticus DSM 17038 TaxID=1121424 RepID=A0A1I2XQA9_9FIRM|nr:TetR/AcrR family transcriptional regulator [Desulfotruncus arcticus]SFH15229.1 transcriptional regulator, TetR family [Desulfotomaculum arcticum] [Desulfotruncus arcticus DSM 17038]
MTAVDNCNQTRRDRKKEQARTKIIDLAIDLFEKQGFEQTSMEQIAREADVAKRTLYNYFSGKGAILLAYMQRINQNYDPLWQKVIDKNPNTKTRLMAMLEIGMDWASQNKDIFIMYAASRLQDMASMHQMESDKRSGLQGVFERVIRRGQEDGELRTDMPAEAIAALLHSNVFMVLMTWMMQGDAFPVRLAVANTIDLFLNGSLKRKV